MFIKLGVQDGFDAIFGVIVNTNGRRRILNTVQDGVWNISVVSFWKRTQPKEISECNSSVVSVHFDVTLCDVVTAMKITMT